MLKPEHIEQLKSLIDQAESNGEDPKFIQETLIPAFKQKYDVPETTSVQTVQQASSQAPTSTTTHPTESSPVVQKLKELKSRFQTSAYNVWKPTEIGQMVGAKPGTIQEGIVGAPERLLRLGLSALGTLADALVATPISIAAGGYNELADLASGGKVKQAEAKLADKFAKSSVGKSLGAMFQKYGEYKESLPEASQANLNASESGVNALLTLGGMGAQVSKSAGVTLGKSVPTKLAEKSGKVVENIGKQAIARDAKISNSIANLAGRNPKEGVQRIINDVSKYKVESPTGGFDGIANKAQKVIDIEKAKAEKAIEMFSKKNPSAVVDVDNSVLKFADDLEKGVEPNIFMTEDRASDIALNIHTALEKRGLTGIQPVSKLPEIKRTIDQGMDLFSKGSHHIELDPLPKKVGELYYGRLKQELESFVPEIASSNKAVYDLLNVKEAMQAASKLAGNRNHIGITDLGVVFGLPAAAHSLGFTPTATGLSYLTGLSLVAKKAAGDARGASALVKTGRTIKDIAASTEKLPAPVRTAIKASLSATATNAYNKKLEEAERKSIIDSLESNRKRK